MPEEDERKCLDIAKDQTSDGAHLLDLLRRLRRARLGRRQNALASRLATASTLPIMVDSTGCLGLVPDPVAMAETAGGLPWCGGARDLLDALAASGVPMTLAPTLAGR